MVPFFLTPTSMDIKSYDYYIVAFSGGKDSVATVLWLLGQGIEPHQIELWHHEIDGREGNKLFMDWPSTPGYCRKFAKVMGMQMYFSWRQGGFAREMLRKDEPTAPVSFEIPGGEIITKGGKGPKNTRRKFPQVSPDLSVRWCSAYLKIDVMTVAIRGQERFKEARTVVLTGERAQESTARANYCTYEPDRTDARKGKMNRHVDHLRPVHDWTEQSVWEIIEAHRINPHPAYRLGWGRLSCASCIFGSCNQFASYGAVRPNMMKLIANYEHEFGTTIDRKMDVMQKAALGEPYAAIADNLEVVKEALDQNWDGDIIVDKWELPAGAYGESNGPT